MNPIHGTCPVRHQGNNSQTGSHLHSELIQELSAFRQRIVQWEQLENERLQAEQRFRLVVEAAPNAMVMVDAAGNIVLVNAQCERLFGYDRQEMLGQPVELLLPEKVRQKHAAFREGFFAPQAPTAARAMGAGRDLYGRLKDGSEVPVEIGLNPLTTSEGVFVLASIIDIRERKRAEMQFRLAVEAAPNAMAMVNQKDGCIMFVNAETERVFGYERSELVGKPLEWLVPGWQALLKEKDEGGAAANVVRREWNGRRQDGQRIPVEIGLNPMETEEGGFILASLMDVSERKRIEASMLEAEMARAGEKTRAEFLARMSHEIRTPLSAVLSLTQILLGTSLTAEQRDYADTVFRAGEALLSTVNDILDFSRLEAGKVALEAVPMDLADVVHECLEFVTPAAVQKQLGLAAVFSPEVPRKIIGDALRLRQLLLNLINNAAKFTETGGVVVHVDVAHGGNRPLETPHLSPVAEGLWEDSSQTSQVPNRPSTVCIEFSVRDTGIGICQEALSSLFEPFVQVDCSTTRRFGGSGLGLSIAQRLAEAMGGEITVQSQPSKGSTFSFRCSFPVALDGQPATDTDQQLLNDQRMLRQGSHRSRKKKVFIVEPLDVDRHALQEQMEIWGFQDVCAVRRALDLPMAPPPTETDNNNNNNNEGVLVLVSTAACDCPVGLKRHIERFLQIQQGALDPGHSRVIWMMPMLAQTPPNLQTLPAGFLMLRKPLKCTTLMQALFSDNLSSPLSRICPALSPACIPANRSGTFGPHRKGRLLLVDDNVTNQKVGSILLKKMGYSPVVACGRMECRITSTC